MNDDDNNTHDEFTLRFAESYIALKEGIKRASNIVNDAAAEALHDVEDGEQRTLRRSDAAAELMSRTIPGDAEAILGSFAPHKFSAAAGRDKSNRARFVYGRLMQLDGKNHFPINPKGAFEAADALKKWPEDPGALKMVGEYIDRVAETPPEKTFKERVTRTPVKQSR